MQRAQKDGSAGGDDRDGDVDDALAGRIRAATAALGELGELLDRGNEAAFAARLPSFLAMESANLEQELADPFEQDYRSTLLVMAVDNGLADATAALLAAGADPSTAIDRGVAPKDGGVNGATALHWASASACAGASRCVELLIQAGADLEAVDWRGATPLGWAASNGALPQLAALLSGGARLGAPSGTPGCPWALAGEREKPGSLEMMAAWIEARELGLAVAEQELGGAKGARL